MPDWPAPQVREAEVIQLRQELAIAQNNVELAQDDLRESWADAELALEDRGWYRLTAAAQIEFSRAGLLRATNICRVSAITNPLLKRGLALRNAYVWGQGISISARDEAVNAVIQDFLDDEGTQRSLHSGKAQERQERAFGTDGNLAWVLFTSPLTGKVQPRPVPYEEITDVITNPEDRSEVWYFIREFTTLGLLPSYGGAGSTTVNQRRRVIYPALGYYPAQRPPMINGVPVQWGAPLLHEKVNELDGWQWGIGDVYAALPWARMHGEFLVDWARIARALSKMAWRLSGDRSSKAMRAAAKLQQVVSDSARIPALGGTAILGGTSMAGDVAASGPGMNLEAIPKTGATLDAESGKPLAAMAASALGVPVTMLLADPGQTGARAVAETLDRPTELEMEQRRDVHKTIRQRILDYVIDQAVIAPRGPLKGTVRRVGDAIEVQLPASMDRTLDIVFPPMTQQDPNQRVVAIVEADSTQKLPAEVTVRLLLEALDVDDIDQIITAHTDAEGNYISPQKTAADVAVTAHMAGLDPASLQA